MPTKLICSCAAIALVAAVGGCVDDGANADDDSSAAQCPSQQPDNLEDEPIGCSAACSCASYTCNYLYAPGNCAWDCQLPKPCDPVRFDLGVLNDLQAYQCIMNALAAGTEGSYSASFFDSEPVGQYGRRHSLHVLPNRQLLANFVTIYDLSFPVLSEGPLTLQEPAYFTQCAAASDDATRQDCMRSVAQSNTCP